MLTKSQKIVTSQYLKLHISSINQRLSATTMKHELDQDCDRHSVCCSSLQMMEISIWSFTFILTVYSVLEDWLIHTREVPPSGVELDKERDSHLWLAAGNRPLGADSERTDLLDIVVVQTGGSDGFELHLVNSC